MESLHDDVPGLTAALLSFGTATLHEAQGQTGALASALKPLDPASRVAGRALTVDARPGDNLVIHHAITLARPGDVLVIDAKGFVEAGPWGDILTLAAQKAGIAGLVIDGSVRDATSIIEMGFPVFCRGLSIRAAQKSQSGRVGVAVVCGNVAIEPGDWIVGDRDGLVAIPCNTIEMVLAAAKAREVFETDLRKRIAMGISTVELLGLGESLHRVGLVAREEPQN